MTIPQQLLTAFLILVSLPLVLKLLWKVRLLPFVLGLSLPYLMGQQWAAEHKAVYLVLLIGGALFALAVWTYRIVDAVRTERWYRKRLLERATPLYPANGKGALQHLTETSRPLKEVHAVLVGISSYRRQPYHRSGQRCPHQGSAAKVSLFRFDDGRLL